ncbi:MAG: lipid II flippase MurJ [Blastocatellia bacterium]
MDSSPGSINRRIFQAAIVIATVTAGVKVAALTKEMVVAWRFGIGDELDAFNVAQNIPFLLISIAGTSFQTAFIPTYIQVQRREGTLAAQQLFASSLLAVGGIFIALLAVILLAAPLYLPALARGFTAEKRTLTFQLLCLITPTIFLTGMSNFWGAVLNVRNVFAPVAAIPLATILVTVLLLLLVPALGIYTLATALTLGASLELGLSGYLLHRGGISFAVKWYGNTPYLKQIARLSLSLMASNLLASGSGLVNVAIAAGLAAGSVASLGYANKLIAMPIGLMATALGTALMPHFSRMTAEEDWPQVRHTLKRFIQLSLGLTLPVTVMIVLFAQPLTRLIFQRGAFGHTDANIVSVLLFYLALQLPFYAASTLISRLLEALQANRALLIVTSADFLFSALGAWLLSRKMQVAGIALAITLTRCCSFFILVFLTRRVIRKAQCA